MKYFNLLISYFFIYRMISIIRILNYIQAIDMLG